MISSELITGSLSTQGDKVECALTGMGGAAIQISGTFVGTIQFEGTVDGGTWVALTCVATNASSGATSTSAAGVFQSGVTGLLSVRARMSTYTSGQAAVQIRATQATPSGIGGTSTGGTSSSFGATFPGTGTAIGVQDDSGNMGHLLLDASGNLKVIAAGGGSAVTIADGADVAEGAVADAAVTGDNTGTVSAKLRGLSKIWADVWDSVNHWLKVSIQNTSIAITRAPATSGGTSDYHVVSLATNNAAAVKAAAGQVYGVHGFNKAAYPVYVKLFNKATAPDPTADTVIRTIALQAGVRVDDLIDFGLPFATGIGIAIVKDIADNGGTSVAAADCVVDVDYK